MKGSAEFKVTCISSMQFHALVRGVVWNMTTFSVLMSNGLSIILASFRGQYLIFPSAYTILGIPYSNYSNYSILYPKTPF